MSYLFYKYLYKPTKYSKKGMFNKNTDIPVNNFVEISKMYNLITSVLNLNNKTLDNMISYDNDRKKAYSIRREFIENFCQFEDEKFNDLLEKNFNNKYLYDYDFYTNGYYKIHRIHKLFDMEYPFCNTSFSNLIISLSNLQPSMDFDTIFKQHFNIPLFFDINKLNEQYTENDIKNTEYFLKHLIDFSDIFTIGELKSLAIKYYYVNNYSISEFFNSRHVEKGICFLVDFFVSNYKTTINDLDKVYSCFFDNYFLQDFVKLGIITTKNEFQSLTKEAQVILINSKIDKIMVDSENSNQRNLNAIERYLES